MGLMRRLLGLPDEPSRSDGVSGLTADQFIDYLNFNGNRYTIVPNQTISGKVEDIDRTFEGFVRSAYQSNGVVFACMLARLQLFTEARFQFQRLRNGRPAELFGSTELDVLEHPWPNASTGDLLARMIQDVDLAGNFFATRRGGAIRRLRPDWVTMVLGSRSSDAVEAGDIDAELLGVIYHPGGRNSGRPPEALLREEICHFAPIPDPLASYRGMSWLTPVLREIAADKIMTEHRVLFFENGATPNMVVSIDATMKQAENPAAFREWVALFKEMEPKAWDAYRTMYLAGGTSIDVVGKSLNEIDFRQVQGAGETRIAAAAGVPPVIVGLSEGLQAATYSNYGQARRRFADNTMRPLWRSAAGALEDLIRVPPGTRLWYDDRDIQALAEDKKDLAEVRSLEAAQMRSLLDGGFTPESVIAAVTAGDWTRLSHTGLFSVQLQPPGTTAPAPTAPVPARALLDPFLADRSLS